MSKTEIHMCTSFLLTVEEVPGLWRTGIRTCEYVIPSHQSSNTYTWVCNTGIRGPLPGWPRILYRYVQIHQTVIMHFCPRSIGDRNHTLEYVILRSYGSQMRYSCNYLAKYRIEIYWSPELKLSNPVLLWKWDVTRPNIALRCSDLPIHWKCLISCPVMRIKQWWCISVPSMSGTEIPMC